MPGSKSLTNRVLILAALATGPSRIRRPLRARDTELMAAALTALGCRITSTFPGLGVRSELTSDDWLVEPGEFHGPAEIDCGLAGTVMRFVPAVAGLASGDVRLDGDLRARARPMSTMIEALRALGVSVADEGRGTLPFTVRGSGRVPGGDVAMDASASSQFVSGLLLAGARYGEGVRVTHIGTGAVPSLPHVLMTLELLRQRGLTVTSEDARWSVAPGPIPPLDVTIEPDLSNAAPYLAAALVTAGSVTIADWPMQTTQAGAALPDLFTAMGATVSLTTAGLTLTGPGRLLGLDADLHDVGELTPVIAACCALAETPSRLSGIAHLRGHETDRLAALATEMNRLGGDVVATEDALLINPRPLRAETFHTYDDHRLATAAAVIGLRIPGILVENIETTNKTLPGFADSWHRLLDGDPEAVRPA